MRVIKIKCLGATDTQGCRLKASVKDHPHTWTASRDYDYEPREQAMLMAQRFLVEYLEWNNCEVVGFGLLDENTYVATLGEKQ